MFNNKITATLHELDRFCSAQPSCPACLLSKKGLSCHRHSSAFLVDEVSAVVRQWCDENPIWTKQDEFLTLFPNAQKDINGILDICPKLVIGSNCPADGSYCSDCCRNYWTSEFKSEIGF